MKDGYSYATLAANVHELAKTLSRVQAVAAAYAHARLCYFARYPQGALPAWLTYPKGYRLQRHYDKQGRPNLGKAEPRKNPRASMPSQQEMAQAIRLHKGFTGRAPHSGKKIRLPAQPRAGVVLGSIIQVGYESARDGANYLHKFRKNSRPLLVASNDGKQALIVGGRFVITARGIEDR